MIPDELCDRARNGRCRLVLPEGDDERILSAALRLAHDGLARPILLSQKPEALTERLTSAGNSEIEVIASTGGPEIDRYARVLSARREGMTGRTAARLLTRPLYLGSAMVAAGAADAMVAGVAHSTRRVIEACLMTIGLADGVGTLSSFDLVVVRDPPSNRCSRMLLFSDCSVNVDPSPDELADIAIASADSARLVFNAEPKVALLSFSTHGSAQHARVAKVQRACAAVRLRRPDIAIDGEMQVDAALSKDVAKLKVRSASGVAGQANVLIFPDLDAGNIAAKLLQYLGGADIVGSVLQGLASPVADLSRGASVQEIVETAVLTLSVAAGGKRSPSDTL